MKKIIKPVLIIMAVFNLLEVVAQEQFISNKDPQLQYEGRTIDTAKATMLSWPGSSVSLRFKGKFLKATLLDTDTADYFNIIVDKKIYKRIHVATLKKNYLLVDKLKPGVHTVELFKLTESEHGNCLFYGFSINSKGIVTMPLVKSKRIEFYGNSITCGYSVEDSIKDRGDGYYENNYLSYAAITARHYNAHYSCISKSGIGVTVSWFPLIMPEMYDRSTENNAFQKWGFNKWGPQIVVINLFQNDAWITNLPDNSEYIHRFHRITLSDSFFINRYKDLVSEIRGQYRNAKIICSIGSMDASASGSKWVGYIKGAIEQSADRNLFLLVYPYKHTSGHPKILEQRKMADILINFIDKHHLWK